MATAKKHQQEAIPHLTPWIIAGGILLAVAATWYGYPGMPFVWLSLIVAGWTAVPPILSGPKSAAGYPTPADIAEQVTVNWYRIKRSYRWRLIFPNLNWLPGFPPLASWVTAVCLAVLAWLLPAGADTFNLWNVTGDQARLANVIATYVIAVQLAASKRQFFVEGDVCPGLRFDKSLARVFAPKGAWMWVKIGLVAVLMLTVGVFTLAPFAVFPEWVDAAGQPPIMFAAAAAVLAGMAAVSPKWRYNALHAWEQTVAARKEWRPRWQQLKYDPSPTLLDHREVGNAVVDTFAAPAGQGAGQFYPLEQKIGPVVGAGTKIAILECPNLDAAGNPTPGTRHPVNFQIVTWPSETFPDTTDPNADADELDLFARCAVVWAADEAGYARPILDQIVPVHQTAADVPTAEDDDGDTGGGQAVASPVAVWKSTWHTPDGPPFTHIRSALLPAIAGNLNAAALVDHRGGGAIYFGAIGSDELVPSPGAEQAGMPALLDNLSVEDVWNDRWRQILKRDANPPIPAHEVYAEATLADGTRLYRQPFQVRSGDDPKDFFRLEKKIATATNAAPFVAVTGFPGSGDRPGERHPQAFAVHWATGPVPYSPAKLVPGGRGDAARWVLAGRINEAFDAARIPRGELAKATPLTSASSTGHIWQLNVRPHDGVTIQTVRSVAEKIKNSLGCPWLRVSGSDDGVLIVAGADPAEVTLRDEKQDRPFVVSLDWEQAFADAKVVGANSALPRLVTTSVMEYNPSVRKITFELPSGVDLSMVRQAISKLNGTTENAFISADPDPESAARIILMVSEKDPMPTMVQYPFDFDYSAGIPFATTITGAPLTLDFTEDPHLLIAGTTGSGKTASGQEIMFGAFASGMDVVLIDKQKKGADFTFAKNHCCAFVTTVNDARATLEAVYAEVGRRVDLNATHGAASIDDLPDEVRPRPMAVFIDEFLGLVQAGDKPGTKPEDDPELESQRLEEVEEYQAKRRIAYLTGRIAAEARSARIHLLLMTQKLTKDSMPPSLGDLKTNQARILQGRTNYGERMSALKNPDAAPDLGETVPKGRGIFESTTSTGVLAQFWFATASDFAEHLAELCPPIDDNRRLDLDAHRPRQKKQAIEGEILDDSADDTPAIDDLELDLDDLSVAGDDEPPDWAKNVDWNYDNDADDDLPELDIPADETGHDEDAPEHDAGVHNNPPAAERPREPVGDSDAAVFIDVDGTIAPYGSGVDPAFDDASERQIPGADGDLCLSERMLELLDGLPGAKAWLTGRDTTADSIAEWASWPELDVLDTVDDDSGSQWWKIDALVAFLAGHPALRRIVWVDDELAEASPSGRAFGEIAGELLDAEGIDNLLIATNPEVGLRETDIDDIREFLHQPDAEAHTDNDNADDTDVDDEWAEPEPVSDSPAAPSSPAPMDDWDDDEFDEPATTTVGGGSW